MVYWSKEKQLMKRNETLKKRENRGAYFALRSVNTGYIGIVPKDDDIETDVIVPDPEPAHKGKPSVRTEGGVYLKFLLPNLQYYKGLIENFNPGPYTVDGNMPWVANQLGIGKNGMSIALGEDFYNSHVDVLIRHLDSAIEVRKVAPAAQA